MCYFNKGEGTKSGCVVKDFFGILVVLVRVTGQIIRRAQPFRVPLVFQLVKGMKLALAPLYLGSLYGRLDEAFRMLRE